MSIRTQESVQRDSAPSISTAELARLEMQIQAHPAVFEAAARERIDQSLQRCVIAYVQPSSRCTQQMLRDHLQHSEHGCPTPDHIVLVSSLPRDADGVIDEQALNRLEVLDDTLANEWEEAVVRASLVPTGTPLAVVVADRQFARKRVAMADLLADPAEWRSTRVGIDSTQPDSDGPLAIIEGAPLVLPPGTPSALSGVLQRAAERSADRSIIHIGSNGVPIVQTYPQLLDAARRVLTGLKQLGLQPGQQVLLQLERSDDYLAGFWGCILGGFVPVPVSIASAYQPDNATVQRLKHAWQMLDAPPILASDALVPVLNRLGKELAMDGVRVASISDLLQCDACDSIHQPDADDLALLLLTSGSTGAPKAVMHTHRTLISRSAAACEFESQTRDDVSVNWMPLDHVGGVVMFHLRDVFAGCTQIHAPTNWILEQPLRWLDLLSEHRATVTWAPNFAFATINDQADAVARGRWDLASLRFVLNGGEMVVAQTARRFMQLLAPHGLRPDAMKPAWGMSETASGVTYNLAFDAHAGEENASAVQVGESIPGFAARIVDQQDRTLKQGQIGRLQVRGAQVTRGYFKNPQRNAEAFTEDGWFQTGDLARIDSGSLCITGREKDEIIVNGINIPAAEIETIVESVHGVRAGCTAATPMRRSGAETDDVALFFAASDHESEPASGAIDALADAIRERVRRVLGIVPGAIVPLASHEIPRTSIGKIRRGELREQLEAGAFDARIIGGAGAGAGQSVPQWWYRPMWAPQQLRTASDLPMPGTALIVSNPDDTTEPLQRALSADGWHTCVVAEPISRLTIHGALPDVIFHRVRGNALDASTELLRLIQILHRAADGSPRRVRMIAWCSGTDCDAAAAASAALLRTAGRELPWLAGRCVQFGGVVSSENVARLLCDEANGWEACAKEIDVEYRGGKRFVRRLQQIDINASRGATPLRVGGRYLITGGLGGIGAQLAQHLLTHWQAKLLLIGRASIDQPERAMTLARLQGIGDVRYEVAAAEERSQLSRAVERAEAHWGARLDGAFHLAGEFHSRSVTEEDSNSLRESMIPKLDGVNALRQVLAERGRGKLLVGFGSVNGYFGGSGAGAYAAANAAMSAALLRQLDDGVDARCLDWSMWANIGMSRGYADTSATAAAGFDLIDIPQGMASMEASLRRSERHVLIGVNEVAPVMQAHVAQSSKTMHELTLFHDAAIILDAQRLPKPPMDRFGNPVRHAVRAIQRMPSDRAALLEALENPNSLSGLNEPQSTREKRVAEIFAEILGTRKIGPHDHFLEIGGNSLSATQVISRLRPMVGSAGLTVRDLFEHPTVAELAAHIDRLIETPEEDGSAIATISSGSETAELDISGLSDEQVDQMLGELMADREAQP